MTLTRSNDGLAAQLRYLNEMLAELAGKVGAESDDLTACQAVESELRHAADEHREAAERVALAKARLAAAESLLAQTAAAEAQTEARCRGQINELLQNLAARPESRSECVRSLQAIFTDSSTGQIETMPAPQNTTKRGFWNKLFSLEPATEDASFKLFALTPADLESMGNHEAEPTAKPVEAQPLTTGFAWQERAAH